ncbi:MAG: hypothetical protein IJU90_04315 [Bacteroidales bacterium]|nr:hypothetical protein [Bacteroidales bacterium]
MCTLNIKVDDSTLAMVRPHFNGDKALQAWFEMQMEMAMTDFLSQFQKPTENTDNLLERLEALGDTPEGFLNLDTVLPPSQSSLQQIREESYLDKYGL